MLVLRAEYYYWFWAVLTRIMPFRSIVVLVIRRINQPLRTDRKCRTQKATKSQLEIHKTLPESSRYKNVQSPLMFRTYHHHQSTAQAHKPSLPKPTIHELDLNIIFQPMACHNNVNHPRYIPNLNSRPTRYLQDLLHEAQHINDTNLQDEITDILQNRSEPREEYLQPLGYNPAPNPRPDPWRRMYPRRPWSPLPPYDLHPPPAPPSSNANDEEGVEAQTHPALRTRTRTPPQTRFTDAAHIPHPRNGHRLRDGNVLYVTDELGIDWTIEEVEPGYWNLRGNATFPSEEEARDAIERAGGIEGLLEGVVRAIPEIRRNGGVVEEAWISHDDEQEMVDMTGEERRGRRRYRDFERSGEEEEGEGVFGMDRDY